MKSKHIIRYGTDAAKMRSMVEDDILISRLNLLIIMAKAYLKSYPTGEFRRKAISENARVVFFEAYRRAHSNETVAAPSAKPRSHRCDISPNDQLFLQRAQLLAAMVHAFTAKSAKGNFRKKAMAENIERISEYLADGFQFGDIKILKVA